MIYLRLREMPCAPRRKGYSMSIDLPDIKAFGTAPFEAFTAATASSTKGLQTIAAETTDYSKKSFEKSRAHFEKLIGVKKIDKAIQLQSDFAKSAYEDFEPTLLGLASCIQASPRKRSSRSRSRRLRSRRSSLSRGRRPSPQSRQSPLPRPKSRRLRSRLSLTNRRRRPSPRSRTDFTRVSASHLDQRKSANELLLVEHFSVGAIARSVAGSSHHRVSQVYA